MTLTFHLAPPLLTKRDRLTGLPIKRNFGGWMLPILKVLARMRSLRGTPLDLFGYTQERRTERALVDQYEQTVEEVAAGLDGANYEAALSLLSAPEAIRGYGHVKAEHLKKVHEAHDELLATFREAQSPRVAA